jgi:FG-GAP-like repeat
MTRRIRFSSFLARGVFAGATLLVGASGARAGEVPFVTQAPVTTQALLAISLAAGDFDGDGDLDLLSASANDNTVAEHENVDGKGLVWTTRFVATTALGAFDVDAADVDRDGDIDPIDVSYLDGNVNWFETVSTTTPITFLPHSILTNQAFPVSVKPADVDRDGDVDLGVALAMSNAAVWVENQAGDGSSWVIHTIASQLNEAFSVFWADVDGDGSLDMVVGSYNDDRVTWFQNVQDGTLWVPHTVSTLADGVRCVHAADMDGDGDTDLISASFYDNKLAWYENVNGDGTLWLTHTVSQAASAPRSVVAVDQDGDGDLDLALASTFDDTIAWYENVAGNGLVWTRYAVSTGADGAFKVIAVDLDGDGDSDLASASGGDNKVAWYRNEKIHSGALYTETVPISTAAAGASSVFGADVDGDGDQDAFSASSGDNRISWHENVAGDGSLWNTVTITTTTVGAAGVAAGDVDGDGDLDVFSASSGDNRISWHENVAGDGSVWNTVTITNSALGAAGVAVGDVDGDANLDVAWRADDCLGWSGNVAGDGSLWQTFTIAGSVPGASGLATGDVDKDGDLDVCWSAGAANTIGCSLNLAGDGSVWNNITVTALAPGASCVALADIDKDGDLDLFGCSEGDDLIRWFENLGLGSSWGPHIIATSILDPSNIVAADVDRDGDVDAVVTSTGDDRVRLLENLGNGSAWRVSALVTQTVDPSSAYPADVDHDGRLDLFFTSAGNDTLGWEKNCGGQFSLDATDLAPATAPEELARLGLLFEEAPGDPLTSSEANALVESLRVYRDANANGNFDAGSDALVTSLPNLNLAGGIQIVSFNDGDPNVQVDFGAPKTYFVVSELTANAGLQSPNRFRITHLGSGPSASQVEDRSYDIPLLPACPTDQASGIVRAVNALSADVSAVKTVSGFFHPGEPISYEVTLINAGPGNQPDSPSDELQDSVPPEVTVVGADDGGDPGTVSVVGNDVRWNGTTAPGASVTVTIQASINAVAPGTQVTNQGVVTFDSDGNGSGDTMVLSDDPSLPGIDDPSSFVVTVPVEGDLVHGTVLDLDLASPGTPDVDLFGFRQQPHASYEVVVDATTGDLGTGGSGPALELVAADGTTLLQSSSAAGSGASRSLRFENATSGPVLDRLVRVASQGCTTNCTPEDRYRLRAFETTLGVARLNNSSSQVTILLLQNPTPSAVTGHVWLWDSAGALAGSVPFTIAARGSFVLNTASVAPGMAGSLTVSHDAPYGSLAVKATALEPATGYTFDTPSWVIIGPR